ncbi:hypothetical protein Lfu02_75960 [Longispora fulva]|uniref:Uncharacterized protein n=1 Tax=Longispora fulva TaxID=619741 RepID=A0A8J7GGH8_9ACTN|nr:hypothetical protein [Longispora fulva]MBG6136267.1 hypothetical protein [Longispora fulva]GIG63224.1 hypothetical protein Lfu02_75960 [Longispora fulva]
MWGRHFVRIAGGTHRLVQAPRALFVLIDLCLYRSKDLVIGVSRPRLSQDRVGDLVGVFGTERKVPSANEHPQRDGGSPHLLPRRLTIPGPRGPVTVHFSIGHVLIVPPVATAGICATYLIVSADMFTTEDGSSEILAV